MNDHRRNELRSICLHEAVAAHLRADPSLLDRVWQTIERDRATGDSGARRYADRWAELIRSCSNIEELADRIVEDSAEMRALRQNTPFRGILGREERNAIMRRFWSR